MKAFRNGLQIQTRTCGFTGNATQLLVSRELTVLCRVQFEVLRRGFALMNGLIVRKVLAFSVSLLTFFSSCPVYAGDDLFKAQQAESCESSKSETKGCPFDTDTSCEIKPPGRFKKFLGDLFWQPGCRFEHLAPNLYFGARPGHRRMRELKAMRVKTVICFALLFQRHTAKLAKREGLNYYKLRTGLFSRPGSQEIEQFLSIACDPKNQPLYVTCYRGVDRTAFYIAVYRIGVQNWTLDKTLAELKKSELRTWWPVFKGYDKTLRKYFPEIQQIAHRIKSEKGSV